MGSGAGQRAMLARRCLLYRSWSVDFILSSSGSSIPTDGRTLTLYTVYGKRRHISGLVQCWFWYHLTLCDVGRAMRICDTEPINTFTSGLASGIAITRLGGQS